MQRTTRQRKLDMAAGALCGVTPTTALIFAAVAAKSSAQKYTASNASAPLG